MEIVIHKLLGLCLALVACALLAIVLGCALIGKTVKGVHGYVSR
jgi:hypothetical protein